MERSEGWKLFSQEELRLWIEQTLGMRPVAAAPSVLYVFRTVEDAQGFLASRVRRHVHAYREELTPLVGFLADRGPLPRPEELPNAEEVAARSGASGPRTP